MTAWRKSSYSAPETNCVEVGIAPWRKSSHSGPDTNCVEVGTAPWRKSSYSGSQTDCIETATVPGAVLVRDTKDRGTGPVLSVSAETWRRFTASLLA